MIKSGLIIGAVSFLVILGGSTLISPLCAPCMGLLLGLVAGYFAGIFEKPSSPGEAVKKGGIAGAIAGSFGLVGGMIAGVINGLLLTPSSMEALFRNLGINNVNIDQTMIWMGQIFGGFCIGLFNIAWMAILGVAGGALWYQLVGKNRVDTLVPPHEPAAPGF
ncbi:MAG: hypothetical protein A2032_00400 [Chloroflexi bacterium RBG_19FT_COMBO_49_13]|nr:MAG: hypothetical protein A2032_00400 [Chloroflexi bacterium RBG_19FT_COMBO_49_13]